MNNQDQPIYAKLGMTVYVNDPSLADLPEAASALQGCRFWGIEPDIVDPRRISGRLLGTIVADHGLRISALATGRAFAVEGLSLCDLDPAGRQAAIDRLRAHIDLACELGTHVIVGLVRGVRAEHDPVGTCLGRLADSLAVCGLWAARSGCKLFFEAINRTETNIANTAAEATALIAASGSPAVQLLLDTYHLDREEESITEVLAAHALILGHFHLADRNRSVPGTAGIDFREIMKALSGLGYQGAVNVEIPLAPDAKTCAREVTRNLNELGVFCERERTD